MTVGCLLSTVPAGAQSLAPLPPARAWSGKSEALVAAPSHPWRTPAERAGFETTPSYEETRAWLEKLVASSPLLTLRTFGRTPEGRDLLYVRASKGGAGKPVVLAQAGIHSGEIDGKDAGLMLLRDIAHGGKETLLDRVDWVFVPILNVDGHERSSVWSRGQQRGPREKGWRGTAQNINLNRDYAKADAPETRAIIGLLRELDPALYVDFHVSDGPDMQYDVTYTFAGWGTYARSSAITDWLEGRFKSSVDASLSSQGHVPGVYPSLIDGDDPSSGLRFSPEGPRYSTGYGDFTGIPTVLVENHSLKPYKQRVLGAYVLMEAALRVVGTDAADIARAKAADRAARPERLMVKWERLTKPIGSIDFMGIRHERYRSPASGREEVRWTGKPVTTRRPIIGHRESLSVDIPKAWFVPAWETEAIERLALHGIRFETLDSPVTLTLDTVRLFEPRLGPVSEGRVRLQAKFQHERRQQTVPAGTVRVPSDQPLRLLAAALLEPESDDSLLAWGFFPHILTEDNFLDDYALAPMADRMLAENAAVREAFEAKVNADPAFARDGAARLRWFFEQTPYLDSRYRVHPVLRQVD
ncbi:M14 family metallopeptidase [Myxococcus hansupus]|nr:M14 family metallopeptidase [Myxococcus hansupus]